MDLRREFRSFEECMFTLGRVADKACGRDGMQLGFLRMLSREMQWQFWDNCWSGAPSWATFPGGGPRTSGV